MAGSASSMLMVASALSLKPLLKSLWKNSDHTASSSLLPLIRGFPAAQLLSALHEHG